MPFLLIFAFVPAVLVIALSVALISGVIMFITNRARLTPDILTRIGIQDAINKLSNKIDEFKKSQQARKVKNVETIEIVILKEK